jgi:hypothetical protein
MFWGSFALLFPVFGEFLAKKNERINPDKRSAVRIQKINNL